MHCSYVSLCLKKFEKWKDSPSQKGNIGAGTYIFTVIKISAFKTFHITKRNLGPKLQLLFDSEDSLYMRWNESLSCRLLAFRAYFYLHIFINRNWCRGNMQKKKTKNDTYVRHQINSRKHIYYIYIQGLCLYSYKIFKVNWDLK